MRTTELFVVVVALAASSWAQVGVTPRYQVSSALASQDASASAVLDQITVWHIHDSGWSSHSLQLTITNSSLSMRGNPEFRNNTGYLTYCIFPADILLEQIVRIEAKRGSASLLGTVRLTKLHVEFKDDKGKLRSYDFISQDATQSNNDWYEGSEGGNDLRRFAQTAQSVVEARLDELKHPVLVETASTTPSSAAANDDDRVALSSGTAVPSGSAPVYASVSRQFDAQLVGKGRLFPVVVSTPAASGSGMLMINWKEGGGNNSFSLDDIHAADVKRRPLNFPPPPPPGTIEIPLGRDPGPRIYVLDLVVRSANGKLFTYHLLSDDVFCNGTAACKDGAGNGQRVLDIARTINELLATRAKR